MVNNNIVGEKIPVLKMLSTDKEKLESSSDDSDDVYSNSVARLKALKSKKALPPNIDEEKVLTCSIQKENSTESVLEIVDVPTKTVIPNGRLRPGKRRRKRQSQRDQDETESDSDFEIVSVEQTHQNFLGQIITIEEDDAVVVENGFHENPNLSFSIEDENYDITIKILWRSKDIHRLNICKNETFQKIFEYFADLEQVSVDEIAMMKNEKIIKKNDTPSSINLSIIDILEGGIVSRSNTILNNNSEDKEEDGCLIKVQTTARKKSLTIRVKRNENFEALLEKCAQYLNVEKSKIKLYFDGETVAVTDTPDSLEIEDEGCFDLRVLS